MTKEQLDDILARLAGTSSLTTANRVCLGYTAGGNVPDVDDAEGLRLVWRGSVLPRWLRFLGVVVAANRTLWEVESGPVLARFVEAADMCFDVHVYSCSRGHLSTVLAQMAQYGSTSSPTGVVAEDASYFELRVNCDGADHEQWFVSANYGADCPEDLKGFARAINPD